MLNTKEKIVTIAADELKQLVADDKKELRALMESKKNITDEELAMLERFFALKQWQQNLFLMVKNIGSCRAFARQYHVSHTVVWSLLKSIKEEIYE